MAVEILLEVMSFVALKTVESSGREQQGNDLIDHQHNSCFSSKYVPGGIWLTCQLSQWSVIFTKDGNWG